VTSTWAVTENLEFLGNGQIAVPFPFPITDLPADLAWLAIQILQAFQQRCVG
jgi:hypothetical protein